MSNLSYPRGIVFRKIPPAPPPSRVLPAVFIILFFFFSCFGSKHIKTTGILAAEHVILFGCYAINSVFCFCLASKFLVDAVEALHREISEEVQMCLCVRMWAKGRFLAHTPRGDFPGVILFTPPVILSCPRLALLRQQQQKLLPTEELREDHGTVYLRDRLGFVLL